ncbi:MAG: Clp protease ClpP [Chitinophagales bacterium]|nr:Clp protease ClpP [Chitinophagales bacterium]
MKNSITSKVEGESTVINIAGGIGCYFDENKKELVNNSPEELSQQLNTIKEATGDNFRIIASSFGGSLQHGIDLHNAVSQLKGKKIALIDGSTASAGTLPVMAADIIKQSFTALLLIHRCKGSVQGNINDLEQGIEEQKRLDEIMANIYLKQIQKAGKKKTLKDVLALMDENNGDGKWLTAEEARDFGLIDEIYEPKEMASKPDMKIVMAMGLPVIPEIKIINKQDNTMELTLKSMSAKIDNLINKVFAIDPKKAEVKEFEAADGSKVMIDKQDESKLSIGDVVKNEKGEVMANKQIELKEGVVISTDAEGKISDIKPKEEQAADIKKLQAENTALKAELTAIKDGQQKELKALNDKIESFGKMITSKEQVPGEQTMFRKKEDGEKNKGIDFDAIKKERQEARAKRIIK